MAKKRKSLNILPDDNVGARFTDESGNEWFVWRKLKTDYVVESKTEIHYGDKKRVPHSALSKWKKHILPEKAVKGAVWMYHGKPVTITSLTVCGGQPMVGFTGDYGLGVETENLIPLYQGMIHEGYRLPFEGELSTNA